MNRAGYTVITNEGFREHLETYRGGTFAPLVSEAIRRGLDKANLTVVGRIKRKRLTGSGPFPISQNRLGHRSRRLIRDFDAAPARVVNAEQLHVVSSLGSNVKYFGGHEFGFDGQVKVAAHSRTMPEIERKSSEGKRYTVPEHVQKVKAHSRHMKIPARKMVRTELADQGTKEIYEDAMINTIIEDLDDNA